MCLVGRQTLLDQSCTEMASASVRITWRRKSYQGFWKGFRQKIWERKSPVECMDRVSVAVWESKSLRSWKSPTNYIAMIYSEREQRNIFVNLAL